MGTNNNSVTLQVHHESHTISPCIKREWFHLLLQEKLATQQLFLNQGALLVPKEVFFLQAVIPCFSVQLVGHSLLFAKLSSFLQIKHFLQLIHF